MFMPNGFWLFHEIGVEGTAGRSQGARLQRRNQSLEEQLCRKGQSTDLGLFGDLPCDVEGSGTTH